MAPAGRPHDRDDSRASCLPGIAAMLGTPVDVKMRLTPDSSKLEPVLSQHPPRERSDAEGASSPGVEGAAMHASMVARSTAIRAPTCRSSCCAVACVTSPGYV